MVRSLSGMQTPLTNISFSPFEGSPWGSGTYAGLPEEGRLPTALELEIAMLHGKQFYTVLSRVTFERA